MAGFGDDQRKTECYPRVTLQVNGTLKEIIANVVDVITCPIQRAPLSPEEFPILTQVKLADPGGITAGDLCIDMLVGIDYYYQFIQPGWITVSKNLLLLNSKFGYIPTGKVCSDNHYASTLPAISNDGKSLDVDLKMFWELEQIGIYDSSDVRDDDVAMAHFNENVQFDGERYSVHWPWREDCLDPPDTYQLASGRLKSLMKRMSKTPDLVAKYNQVFTEQLEKGIIEEVEEVNGNTRCHYLPHHPVVKESSETTKVRVVFDASAKTKAGNASLNDCLHKGPSLTPDLCGILLRFRLKPVALIADVEKAFLQIGLAETDRDVTRFLWLKDVNAPVDANNVKAYRFCRVPFGVISSPFLLSATVQHHLSKEDSKFAEDIQANMYVDNVLVGTDELPDALDLYQEAKQIFNNASMNLRSWSSNSPEFLESIPEKDRSETELQKCLGLQWNTLSDTINIQPVPQIGEVINTKRTILQRLSRFYDPMGYHGPIIMRAKCLLQQLWKEGFDWDVTLPESYVQQWNKIAEDLELASSVKIPRYLEGDPASYELHIFCDASQIAYGAAAYLRQVSGNRSVAHLIMCKTRVAPIKEQTIPRLELLATVIGIRLVHFIRQQVPFQFKHIGVWTDSTAVLGWIQAPDKKQPVFVENRLTEIRAEPDVEFRHIASGDNPADYPSRGGSVSTSMENNLWWHGPSWLSQPQTPMSTPISVLVRGEGPAESQPLTTPAGIDPCQFTSFQKLLRVTAYVQRFTECLRTKSSISGRLTTDELSKAEVKWLSYAQHVDYNEVFRALEGGKKNDLVSKHGLFVDDNGTLKCNGRMQNASLPAETRQPVFLSGKSDISKLIIADAHRKLLHGGTNATLVAVRKKFWITRGRETIKRLLKQCQLCKKFDGGPYAMPEMPPYPTDRVTGGRMPFSTTGVDYFGPITVKGDNNPMKAWVVLFTCLTTRAVHLELVLDMTTNTFLMAYRRFTARRGTPSRIISDNGKQFKLANSTIGTIYTSIDDCTEVMNYIATNGTNWSFITELSPWMGGFYERMVQTVKRALRKCIGRSLLSVYEMETLLIECEAVVNARPLVYVSEDPEQLIITPAHFLCLNPNIGFPSANSGQPLDDPNFNPNPSSTDVLLKQLEHGQSRLEQFWKVWSDEYLAALRERGDHQISQGRVKHSDDPSVGDVVLIKEQYQPRALWSLGRIKELHISRDKHVRSATVQLPTGRSIKRPLCLLYPIECPREKKAGATPVTSDAATVESDATTVETDATTVEADATSKEADTSKKERPLRQSAVASRVRLQNHIMDGNV